MSPEPIDTQQFSGPGAVFALILAMVRFDYWYAPRESMAFQTAEKFLLGGTCEHDGVVYDWDDWREMIVGSLGINEDGYVNAVLYGRRVYGVEQP